MILVGGLPVPALGQRQTSRAVQTMSTLAPNADLRLAQQGSNLAVAVAAILLGQLNHVGGQPRGVLSAPRDLALRRAMLPERRTNATLGDMQMRTDMLDAGATMRRA
jgi:hypothetical protein